MRHVQEGTKIVQQMGDRGALASRAKFDRGSRASVSATRGGKGIVPLIDTHNTVY